MAGKTLATTRNGADGKRLARVAVLFGMLLWGVQGVVCGYAAETDLVGLFVKEDCEDEPEVPNFPALRESISMLRREIAQKEEAQETEMIGFEKEIKELIREGDSKRIVKSMLEIEEVFTKALRKNTADFIRMVDEKKNLATKERSALERENEAIRTQLKKKRAEEEMKMLMKEEEIEYRRLAEGVYDWDECSLKRNWRRRYRSRLEKLLGRK
ncbi:MAG: uncharacterized protein A8A55_1145 [Amphiamblys sp. WSBS2006]|nr:MAG: uncharacterized protein A8A55_1145 [Amphiamblys sp. WSBS2006]